MLRWIACGAAAAVLIPTAPAAFAAHTAAPAASPGRVGAAAAGTPAAAPSDWRDPTRSVHKDPERVAASIDPGETGEIMTITAHRGRPEVETVSVRGPQRAAAVVAAAQRDEDLLYVGVSQPVELVDPPDSPATASADPRRSELWAFDRLDIDSTWNHVDGTGVKVAVLDTGIATHEDLPDNVVDVTSPLGGSSRADGHGHGTHVAGTIAAIAGNGVGVAGISPGVQLMAVKVLNNQGSGSTASVASGITAAVDAGADVINMSLGGGSPGGYQTVIDYARTEGVSVVAAAGNSRKYNSPTTYPAALDGVTAVAAVDRYSQYGWFSNRGDYVDLAAPGVDVLSTVKDGGYESWNGTSMATPHVSATVALVRQAGAADPEALLMQTAEDLGESGRDPDFGAGLIDPLLAVRTALQSAPQGAQPPDAPEGLAAISAAQGTATISWNPPVQDGGDPVLRYRARGFRNDDPAVRVACSAAAPQTQCSTGNMSAGEYTFTVTAHNRAGGGPSADAVSVPVSVPQDQAGGSVATAAQFPLGSTVREWIQSPDDVDMWRISVTSNSTLVSTVLDQLPQDYDLALLDANGAPLRDWTGADLVSEEHGRSDEHLSVRLNTGTYYAVVYAYSAYSIDQPYRLGITATPPAQPTPSPTVTPGGSQPTPTAILPAPQDAEDAPAKTEVTAPVRPEALKGLAKKNGRVVLTWRSAGAGVRYTVQQRSAKKTSGKATRAVGSKRWRKVATTTKTSWRGRIPGTRNAGVKKVVLRVVPRNTAGKGIPSRAVRIRMR